jgi:hypothetical protein
MTSQHGAYALRGGLARLYARIRMHTPTRPGTHMHARTRKHAHTDQFLIFIAFHDNYSFVKSPQYIACLDICGLSLRTHSAFPGRYVCGYRSHVEMTGEIPKCQEENACASVTPSTSNCTRTILKLNPVLRGQHREANALSENSGFCQNNDSKTLNK